MKAFLLVDFGSTYTKLTAVDLDKCEIIATSKAITTINTNVLDGYQKALEILYKSIGTKIDFVGSKACSSAAGGLKMAAIGLVEELTVEAAKRACLGAGAKVDLVFSHHLTNSEVKKIVDYDIDIILLAGGTNGGNSECILHNAKKLAKNKIKIPIIVAGNKNAQDDIIDLFDEEDIEYTICDNVMPKVNVLNVDSAKEAIRKVFIEKIVHAKGINKATKVIGEVIMPTPQSVLKGAELLSKGYLNEQGLGDLVILDIGGATTDIHSISHGYPKRSDVVLKGLEEPFAKRTVEGDLGMRYSVLSLLDTIKSLSSNNYLDFEKYDVLKEINKRRDNIEFVPKTSEDFAFDDDIAKACADISMTRHVGFLDSVYTPMGLMHFQIGKDLTDTKYVIGTGGVIVNSEYPLKILESVRYNEKNKLELRPKNMEYLIDKFYILSAMGLLSTKHPLIALKVMKKYLINL